MTGDFFERCEKVSQFITPNQDQEERAPHDHAGRPALPARFYAQAEEASELCCDRLGLCFTPALKDYGSRVPLLL
jgi:hypothetical protein